MRRGRRARAALCLGLGMLAMPADAAVRIGFLSRDFGSYYPHAFITLSGAMDAYPDAAVDANYGFTARSIGPAILAGPVPGMIYSESAAYIAGSDRHFSMTLSDDQYRRVIALVRQWGAAPGRSYDLHRRNCVSFVKAVAELIGLHADSSEALMMRPRAFLDALARANARAIDVGEASAPSPHASSR